MPCHVDESHRGGIRVFHLVSAREVKLFIEEDKSLAIRNEKFSVKSAQAVVIGILMCVSVLVLVFSNPILVTEIPTFMDIFYEVDMHYGVPYLSIQLFFLCSCLLVISTLILPHPRRDIRKLVGQAWEVSIYTVLFVLRTQGLFSD